MPLNPFPNFLSYAFFAPFLLRVLLALIFIEFGYSKLTTDKKTKIAFFEKIGLRPGTFFTYLFAFIELVVGVMLLAGFYTQIAALVALSILAGTLSIKQKYPTLLKSEARYYFLLFVIALTLLFTGAGAYSLDIPL